VSRLADGRRIAEAKLPAMPVFDGMSAANGHLFVALKDGTAMCFENGRGERLPEEASASVKQAADLALESDPFAGAARKPKKPVPPPPELAGADRSADFATVKDGRVVASDLGYRLAADKGRTAVAVRRLEEPLQKKLTLTLTLRRAPEYRYPHLFENAFVAFGSGPGDGALVKCGIKFVVNSGVIIAGGRQVEAKKLVVDAAATHKVRVDVDIRKRTVSMLVGDQTVRARFDTALDAVTHVGYCTINAVSDFTPIEVTGE
jgi:hypothetical protein